MGDFLRETEVADVLIQHIKKSGWEVYQEVYINGRIVDILAVKGNKYWAVECKMRMNFDVIEQAYNWCKFVDYVSICVPYPNKRKWRNFRIMKIILAKLGIGFLAVTKSRSCIEISPPPLNDNISGKKYIKLYEEQKTYAQAGSRGGGYYTPFKTTCQNLERIVRSNAGISLSDAVSRIEHHYKNNYYAVRNLSKLLMSGRGIVPGVYAIFDGSIIRLYPKHI